MKHFTDLFIRRPVLASVVSLFIFFLGLRALFALPVQQFPTLENTVIQITTAYPGASADVIQGFITTPIQQAVASASGVDFITASSTQGTSQIKVYIKLNYSPDAAFTSVMSKVSQVSNVLPPQSQRPVIVKNTGSAFDLMYLSFSSNLMSPEQITDYITRVVQPKLQTVSGVAGADILGGRTFAMRIWLDPNKMAALGVSPQQVTKALLANNYQSSAGSTKGEFVTYPINSHTDLHDVNEFKNIVILQDKSELVHLSDIATVQLASQTYDASVTFNGDKAIFVGISATPEANPLSMITSVKKLFPELVSHFPASLEGKIVYDATEYIRSSLHEVIKTLAEATLIVLLVMYLFLGSFRAVFIPVVTIPLSLIGVGSIMMCFGYSINLLTLLAMVLAIGLVVDDAIVVVENIFRHIEEGLTPLDAALCGAREIAMPVISMTITLAAVYAPIGFLTGLTGALFREFAFTLAFAVVISGVIALTLSPMLCSRFLNRSTLSANRFQQWVDEKFNRIRNSYEKRLKSVLMHRPVVLVFAFFILCLIFFFYTHTQQELAPDEDQSVLFMVANAPEYANIDYTEAFTNQYNAIFKKYAAVADYFVVNGADGPGMAFAGTILKPWKQRSMSQAQVMGALQNDVNHVAGVKTMLFPEPSLPVSGSSFPIEFVLTTTDDFASLANYADLIKEKALASGLFMFLDNSLKIQKPQIEMIIDKDKAGVLGISMQDIGDALASDLGGSYINFFSLNGRSYQVIPQLARSYRFNPRELNNIYLTASSGETLPLSTLIKLKFSVQPNALTQFQQLNSATLQGMMSPGVSMGKALAFLQNQANSLLPNSIATDYSGQSRQFMEQGNALMMTFLFALLIIYLVLSAQFESFIDPLIILISVPMSICGALIPLYMGFATVNIYTQIGLITLIGLISKHGILIVQFANELLRKNQLSRLEAITQSAVIRFRPIVMTTAAMVMGVVPLLLASGAGAVSRFDIGLVIFTGMLIGTCFTLFVVPTVYTYL